MTCRKGFLVCSAREHLFHIGRLVRAQGYKTFSMLNSTEHEILNAPKYQEIQLFFGSDKPRNAIVPAHKC